MPEPTCEQRIEGYYKSRMETIGALVRIESDTAEPGDLEAGEIELADNVEDMREQAIERMDEMPLAVEVIRTVKITLGTGGPGDWFECRVDDNGSIDRIDYHFNDWFDHAERNVTNDDTARAFCERFVEAALMTDA